MAKLTRLPGTAPSGARTASSPSGAPPTEPALAGVRAMVTDGESRLALHVIRALGRAGCRVTVLTTRRNGPVLGFSSRYAAEGHRVPLEDYPSALPRVVEGLGHRHDLLMPVTVLSLRVVASAGERLGSAVRFFIPDGELLRVASDKEVTTRMARRMGIPVPGVVPRPGAGRESEWAEEMVPRLPLVLKFADDDRPEGCPPGDRYRIARSSEELAQGYRELRRMGTDPLVQEYVEGDGYGFFALMGPSGEPMATFCHRRLREYPITGGPSTLCESVEDPVLAEHGLRLLNALRWRGVAMVEFKRDRRTGEYRFLEVNPRFWGSLPLALQCGVNFPVYQACVALGRDFQAPEGYPEGQRMRFLLSDLAAAFQEWRSGNRRGFLAGYLRELADPSTHEGMAQLGDPRPVLSYIFEKLSR